MSKMNIADAAEYFGVSKEAIHNRVRRGSLESVVEDGIKMVIVDSTSPQASIKKATPRKASNSDDRYYKLLEEQNAKLQEKVEKLEGETRTLREQKENMLIEERIKIEEIYKQKDEQLKGILSALSSKFMLSAPVDEIGEINHVEAEIEVSDEHAKGSELISLKKYLKSNDFSDKKIQKIKDRFKKRAKKDNRIIVLGKKYYIDLDKYDYSDLI